MERPTKAKRKLSDINFEQEGAHVALVSKQQGGGANGHNYVMAIKATNFSDEFVEKVQQIKVTLSLPDFLERFFSLEEADAEFLATILGYVEPVETAQMEAEEAAMKVQEWIMENTEGFEVMKSLYESSNQVQALSKLSPEDYLAVLTSQQQIEKAFEKLDAKSKEKTKSKSVVKKTAGSDTSVSNEVLKGGVSTPVVKRNKLTKKETNMTQETEKVHVVEQEVEMVAKAAYVDLQKALEDQKVELKKALDIVATMQAKEQEQIAKARKAQVLDAVKDEAKAEVLFKAVGKAEDADFEAVVKALKELASAVDNSDLFVEKGATVEVQDAPQESAVAKLIKAKLQANLQSK